MRRSTPEKRGEIPPPASELKAETPDQLGLSSFGNYKNQSQVICERGTASEAISTHLGAKKKYNSGTFPGIPGSKGLKGHKIYTDSERGTPKSSLKGENKRQPASIVVQKPVPEQCYARRNDRIDKGRRKAGFKLS